MGKNKSLVSFASITIDLKSTLSIPMVCQSGRYHIITRIKFTVKFYVVYEILNFTNILMIFISFTCSV